MNECDESIPFAITESIPIISESFDPGWAKRPKHGQGYGAKYINTHKPFIKQCFLAGEAENGTKWSPAAILESIKRIDPFDLEIPNETEIRGYISSLIQKQKNPVVLSKPTLTEDMLSWLKIQTDLPKPPNLKDIYSLLYQNFPNAVKLTVEKVKAPFRDMLKEKKERLKG